jgi:AAA15 family ATPase/GTPase
MVAGRGRFLSNHIVRPVNRKGMSVLKAAVIYGANASGKSNFVKAIDFAQKLIVSGTNVNERIPLEKFRLDAGNEEKPTKFIFDIKIDDNYFSYGFIANYNRIQEEWLDENDKVHEKKIFHRFSNGDLATKVEFADCSSSAFNVDSEFLNFVAKGTRANQLFLTESALRNVKNYLNVYEWFKNSLKVIFPDTRYQGISFMIKNEDKLKDTIVELLKGFDTGIADLECQKIYPESGQTEIPAGIYDIAKKKLVSPKLIYIAISPENKRYYLIKSENEVIVASRLIAKHKNKTSGKYTGFDIHQESDGTQRIFDLLPVLIHLRTSNNVFIIDEIDRSLHPLIVKEFFRLFLNIPTNSRSQLIVTTHDTNLLNLRLLRKDEIWFIEKNLDGESFMYSLEEFKPRYDKEIQKGYLLGRFGAVPVIRKQ